MTEVLFLYRISCFDLQYFTALGIWESQNKQEIICNPTFKDDLLDKIKNNWQTTQECHKTVPSLKHMHLGTGLKNNISITIHKLVR